MSTLLISLGANLGNSYDTMLAASGMLHDAFGHENVYLSRLYRTPPVGGPAGQSDFLNAVAKIDTRCTCWEVWEILKRIEKDLGRQRQHRWEARRLDIDILLYEDLRVWTPHLKIPHPRMCMRSFVLVPALEIGAEAVEPVTGWTLERLHGNLLHAKESNIVVFCSSPDARLDLERAIANAVPSQTFPSLRFEICSSPDRVGVTKSVIGSWDILKIFCVRTPEPETIQWEDFAYPWAKALGLVGPSLEPQPDGPRYLLPDNDLSWTVHEIEASRRALTCPIEPFGRPFGDLPP
jgi:2-amino-4-hydroxy-6-hydroxymethyldihydropteridine diphosphokinase